LFCMLMAITMTSHCDICIWASRNTTKILKMMNAAIGSRTHTHGNVRVDPERSAVVLDRMKSAVVSVDAVSRTRTECSR
jgi:hypothetical protein